MEFQVHQELIVMLRKKTEVDYVESFEKLLTAS